MRKLLRKVFVMILAVILMIPQIFTCDVFAAKGHADDRYFFEDDENWEDWDDEDEDWEDDEDWDEDEDWEDDEDWDEDEDWEYEEDQDDEYDQNDEDDWYDEDDWENDEDDWYDEEEWEDDEDQDDEYGWYDEEDWEDDEIVYYTVTFMDGDEVISEQEVEEGCSAEEPDVEKEGYDLEWDECFDEVTEDLVINAVWSAKQYKITFDANGGKISTKRKYVTYGEEYGTLPTPKKNKFVFDGWYTKKKGGEVITEESILECASNQKLYAHWTKVNVTKTTLKSAKCKKNKINVNIKAVKGASGYEISYSTDKKFSKKNTKTTSLKSVTATLKGIKKGKTYYVKVRAYTTDSSNKKVFGSYSGVTTVKINA